MAGLDTLVVVVVGEIDGKTMGSKGVGEMDGDLKRGSKDVGGIEGNIVG